MLKERIKNSEHLSPQLKSVLLDKVKRIEKLDLVDKKIKEEKLKEIEKRVDEIEQEVIEDNNISAGIIKEINTEFENKYGQVKEPEEAEEAEFGILPLLIIIAMFALITIMMFKGCID